MMLFAYPQKAAYGRVLPKTKIYQYAGASTAIKDLFVRQVDQIAWAYKLAPETINIPATKAVPEIQIFTIALKTGELKQDVLRCIDKAIFCLSCPMTARLRPWRAINAQVRPTAKNGF